MSHVRMLKCTLVARQRDAEPVLEALQDAGIVHVVETELPAELADEVRRAEGEGADDHEVRVHYENLERWRKGLLSVAPSPARLQDNSKSFPEVMKLVDDLLARRQAAQDALAGIEAQIAALEPWGDFDPDAVRALKERGVDVVFAILTRDDWVKVKERHRSREDPDLAFAVAREEDERVFVVFFSKGGERLSFPGVDLPEERLSSLRERRESLEREIGNINRELGRYAHYEAMIERRMASLEERVDLLRARARGLTVGPLFALQGYVPAENVVELKRALGPYDAALRLDDPAPEDNPPVLLRNNWWTRGFEEVVRAFSGVSYREKDFTWAVGILFIVFGSLCLLDAGYGLLMLATGIWLKSRGVDAFAKVFGITGAFSVVVGLLVGQFFGLVVGIHVYKDMAPPLTLAQEPYHAFLFSLVVGVMALAFSYGVAIWQRGFKTHATGSLLLVAAAATFIFANLAGEYVLTVANGWRPPSPDVLAAVKTWGNNAGIVLLVAAVICFVLYPDPVFGKNAHIGNVIWTLYSSITGFMQDVLSHMRLFGIALSGSIMALVVNEVGGLLPLPFLVLFAVIGHGFVYLLALLSLYIHTNRLIFLEFGSKCIDGGHNPYSPLRRRFPA